MSASEHLNTFVGRLATFESPKQLTKRRASSTKKKTATTVSWPHEAPSPEDLARAGFYYAPSANHPDNVICFMCDRKLDGWEPEDVPALEHLSHAPECAWAINVCLSLRDPEENEDPMSEKMVAARTATFAGSWPHENKKGWKCKIKKMVEAGWVYDPSPDYEDGVACFYCMLSLDGWEPKDNPMEEHRRRSPDCPFFMLNDVYTGAKKATKGNKSRVSTASKASRLSSQSTKDFDTFSEAPSLMSLGDDVPFEDDSVLTTASNATAASMVRGKKGVGKGKAPAKGTRKTVRGKKAAEEPPATEFEAALDSADADLSLGDTIATDGDSAMTTTTVSKPAKGRKTTAKAKATKGTKKATRTTKRAAGTDSTLLDAPAAEIGETELEAEPSKRAVRATRRTSRNEEASRTEHASQLETHTDLGTPKQRATRGRGRKAKALEESRLSTDASQLQSELEESIARAVPEELSRPNKGKKRTSDGSVKADEPVVLLEESPKPAKAKRGKKAKQIEEEPVLEFDEKPENAENVLPPKPAAKPKRGRKAKQVLEENTLDATGQESLHEPSPPPREPTPALESPESTGEPSPDREPEMASKPTSPHREPTPPPQEITPSPSPQSSNAENRPPSSRAASSRVLTSARAPLSSRGIRVPLADASTPQASPSKRSGNMISGRSSAQSWEAVDLENIFLQSPATKRTLNDGQDTDKENGSNWEDVSLDEAVRKVRREMTSAEKKMTVEQWVQFQAEKGEQQLREECERMVSIFETQGTKAMRTLEAIQCSN
ncbi:hypothetical protein MPH_07168 [Macrophomina phaseolina MS6]|uniref:Uncharacterized protein n=1 Tax=Macrophomina phaseolina (strain MS6) TaxID=1126212 RepID=K2RLZ5_MACPH|nr:hypothetical protein MPH_07168 [Macrophomina phaseolina MS6]